eukprot:jgi/Psemu1/250724/estExt_Genewise1Plus.C_200066
MCKSEETLKEYTADEVSKHTTEEDCWMIIGNSNNGGSKVYDVTKYLDDHPGGAEVMLDVSGQNADEFFEDIGHSVEARKELKKYLIGTYKMSEEEIEKMKLAEEAKANQQNVGSTFIVIAIIAAIIAAAYMKFV